VSNEGDGLCLRLRVGRGERPQHTGAHLAEAFSVGKQHFGGSTHPLPVSVGVACGDLIVGEAFQVAEVHFTQIRDDVDWR